MLTFKKKLLLTLAVSTFSTTLYASPGLFTIVDKELRAPNTTLVRDLQDEHQDFHLIKINEKLLASKSSSFLFNIDNQSPTIEIKGNSLEKDHAGFHIWQGMSTNDNNIATFSIHEGKVNGGIRLSDGSFFEIYPIDGGLHVLLRIDMSNLHEDEHDEIWDEAAETNQHKFNKTLSNTKSISANNDIATIKVLYIYTNQSRPSFGENPAGYASYVNSALNKSYANSQTFAHFQVAGVVDAKIDEGPMREMLKEMANASPLGKLVSEKRQETQADLVVLLSKAGEACGVAEGWGINTVVSAGCAVSVHTLAHEIGHNFGLRHNEDEATWPAYANGYKIPGKFRTLMSKHCTPLCPKINFFSNPLMNYDGLSMGTVTSNDSVRFIKERRFAVAGNFPDWEINYALNAGDLPPHQFFEITLTERQTNKAIILDKIINNPGQYNWPYDVAVAVNNYFQKGVVAAGELAEGRILPVQGSSYRNNIWLHLDKKDAYHLEAKQKTYAVANDTNWVDTNNINGGSGLPAHSTVVVLVKNKSTGQDIEQFSFTNGNVDLDSNGWPYKLAKIINDRKSGNLLAGELQKNGDIAIVDGSNYRNRLWLPLNKKNEITVEIVFHKS